MYRKERVITQGKQPHLNEKVRNHSNCKSDSGSHKPHTCVLTLMRLFHDSNRKQTSRLEKLKMFIFRGCH